MGFSHGRQNEEAGIEMISEEIIKEVKVEDEATKVVKSKILKWAKIEDLHKRIFQNSH